MSARSLVKLSAVMGQHRSAQAPVARHQGRSVTWGEFRDDVEAAAQTLRASSESKLTLFCTDAYPFAVRLMAAWQAGKTVCLPAERGQAAFRTDANETNFEKLPVPAVPVPALILFTSGSTGAPKAVEKTFSQLDGELATLEATFGETLGDALILGTVSQQHLYGLLFRVLWPLSAGRVFNSEASLFPEGWFDETAKHARVAWVSSPAFYRRLWAALPWARVTKSVVFASSSGGSLGDDVAASIALWLGQPVTEVFGSTESGGVATRTGQARWRPFKPVSVARREDDGALLVRSPHLPSDEWHVMDDWVELHGETFVLRGRLDRVVKVEDKRVSLSDLEGALVTSEHVQEASVAMVPSSGRHEVGALVVLSETGQRFLNRNGRLTLTGVLKKTVPAHVPVVGAIRRFRFVRELPKNSLGKVSAQRVSEVLLAPRPLMPAVLDVVTSVPDASDEASVKLTLALEADLAALDGHFAGAPVVPGVAQLDWAIRLARRYLSVPARGFTKLEAVKFHRGIQPGITIELSLSWNLGRQRLAFAYAIPQGPVSSGRVTLVGPPS